MVGTDAATGLYTPFLIAIACPDANSKFPSFLNCFITVLFPTGVGGGGCQGAWGEGGEEDGTRSEEESGDVVVSGDVVIGEELKGYERGARSTKHGAQAQNGGIGLTSR
jgi:hypothetical protein